MNILILNCDYDEEMDTNGGELIRAHLNNLGINADIVNCFDNRFPLRLDYDGVIITGSRASVYETLPWITKLRTVIKQIDELSIPTLGICFGFQIIADAFGGTVKSSGHFEEGFKLIKVNGHQLFNSLPKDFLVYESHGDIAVELPSGAKNLSSNWCNEAFQLRNFLGVQFHPEITMPVAQKMAERDRKDINSPVKIANNYSATLRVIENFVNEFCK